MTDPRFARDDTAQVGERNPGASTSSTRYPLLQVAPRPSAVPRLPSPDGGAADVRAQRAWVGGCSPGRAGSPLSRRQDLPLSQHALQQRLHVRECAWHPSCSSGRTEPEDSYSESTLIRGALRIRRTVVPTGDPRNTSGASVQVGGRWLSLVVDPTISYSPHGRNRSGPVDRLG